MDDGVLDANSWLVVDVGGLRLSCIYIYIYIKYIYIWDIMGYISSEFEV